VGAVVASTLVLVLAGSVVYVATSDEDEGAKIAASDGGGGAQTYRGHGVSFDYPVAWQEATSTSEGGSGADELWRATVAAGRLDFVVVSGYRLKRPVTAENLDEFTSEIEGLVRGAVGQAGETVLAGPEEITVAGLPGAWFRVTGTRDGTPLESRLVFVVDGTAEYEVRCQHTAEKADEIEGGCEQILRTFKVDQQPTHRVPTERGTCRLQCAAPSRASLADPLRPLLPHDDPFQEPGQVGTGSDRPPAISWSCGADLAERAGVAAGDVCAGGIHEVRA
jgi:hypothetical protein